MTAQHGILKPNPVLFEIENRKRKPRLAHELGEGLPCQRCGDQCPGFQLHFWRKHCINCKCGKIEHDVIENVDPGFYFVGRIFDLPLRSKNEQLEFCYGSNSSEDEDDPAKISNNNQVKFDWIPPNVSNKLARRYLKELPSNLLPVAGSEGARQRQRNLEKQFPVHDIEPDQCHELSVNEKQSMRDYIAHIKENVAGQGVIQVVAPPKPQRPVVGDLSNPDWLPPPPPELLVPTPSHSPSHPQEFDNSGTYRAEPYFPSESGSGRSSPHISRKPENSVAGSKAIVERGAKCENCHELIEPGKIAIRADRVGSKKLWHPRCFTCMTCKELLVDLLYYYDEGGVYCARDYADRKSIPRCSACDELIFCAEYTGAEDKFWHNKHFCCFECDKPLGGHKYISIEGQPHCLVCYQNKHGKVCRTCGEYIAPEDQRVSIDEKTHWHAKAECFHCNVCQCPLLGKKLAIKFGLVLCSSECARVAGQKQASPASPTGLLTTDV